MTVSYARTAHAPYGRLASCLGLLAQGASQAAHAVLAARAEWVTNEKNLLRRSHLDGINAIFAAATEDKAQLVTVAEETLAVCKAAVESAIAGA
jgi:hypothetical protein